MNLFLGPWIHWDLGFQFQNFNFNFNCKFSISTLGFWEHSAILGWLVLCWQGTMSDSCVAIGTFLTLFNLSMDSRPCWCLDASSVSFVEEQSTWARQLCFFLVIYFSPVFFFTFNEHERCQNCPAKRCLNCKLPSPMVCRSPFPYGLYQWQWRRDQGGGGWIQINWGFAQLQASGIFGKASKWPHISLWNTKILHRLTSIWWIM